MPSILLINDNKIVSRLLQLSSEKNGYNIEEVTDLESSGDSYDVIFVDNAKYSDALLGEIESKLNYGKLGYIGAKQETVPDGFDIVIEKPFLPTDFVDIIKEQVIGKTSPSQTNVEDEIEGFGLDEETELVLDEESIDLDSFDDDVEQLLIEDEATEDDMSDEIALDDEDLLDNIDLSLDPSTIMTTGVATSMALSDNNDPEELADMVSEIDQMEENDLDTLSDDVEPLEEDESGDDIAPLETEEILDEPLLSFEETAEESLDDELLLEEKAKEPEEDLSTLAVGAGTAALGAAASQAFETEDVPDVLENLKEEVSTVDDIDSLHEADVQHALGEEAGEEMIEEIISDEITSDAEETVVESNDVEQWIRDAVAKAITPAMLQEALNGMDISVTLNFNSKKEENTPS